LGSGQKKYALSGSYSFMVGNAHHNLIYFLNKQPTTNNKQQRK